MADFWILQYFKHISNSSYCAKKLISLNAGDTTAKRFLTEYVLITYVFCCAVGNSGGGRRGWWKEWISIRWASGCCTCPARKEERCRQSQSHFCKPFHRYYWSLTISLWPQPFCLFFICDSAKKEKRLNFTIYFIWTNFNSKQHL